METPTSYEQIIENSSPEERKVAALESIAADQRRIADALEVLAADVKFARLAGQVSTLAALQEKTGRSPDRQAVLEQTLQAREDARETLLGVASPWH